MTPTHIITIILFFVLGVGAIYLSRKFNEKQMDKAYLIVAITVTVCEALKITLRAIKGMPYGNMIPLWYCSLFIFAIWLTRSKAEVLRNTGFSFITMGGWIAAVFFTFYPSTSLARYPVWHPASLHSFFYHLLMFYIGVLTLVRRYYIPDKKHSLHYFCFITAACIPAIILNELLDINCMFLKNAYKLPILEPIIEFSQELYTFLAYFAQSVLLYWANYLLYAAIIKIKNSRLDNRE